MQHHHFILGAVLASVTLLPAVAYAAPQVAASPVPVPFPKQSAGIDTLLDESLLNLADIAARKQSALEQLALLSDQLGAWSAVNAPSFPGADALGTGIQSLVDELIARARFTFVTELEAAFLREQVIEARLDRALHVLMVRARTTGWSHEAYDDVVAQLVARARVAIGYPDLEMYRVRLQAAIEEARAAATRSGSPDSLARAMGAVNVELLRSRLLRAYHYVTQRARLGNVSREDTRRILMQLVERARRAATQPFPG